MQNFTKMAALIALGLSGCLNFADSPNQRMYIVKSDNLKQLLQKKHDLANFDPNELNKVSVISAHTSYGNLSNFSFSTPSNELILFEANGANSEPVEAKGWPYELRYVDKSKPSKSFNAKGYLVPTDSTLESTSMQYIELKTLPNTFIRINSEWKTNPYALILISVNAKH